MNKRVLIGMSGGVDSSVAAALLLEEGYDVTGLTLKLWENPEPEESLCSRKTCCSIDDIEDARNVSYKIGINHYVYNMKKIFEEKVIEYFTDSYLKGETPNPCTMCNQVIKFEEMLKRGISLGYDYIATGHYVRKECNEKTGRYLLKKGLDSGKDQSYFLYMLTQDQIKHSLFPLGGYTKEEIRNIATSKELINAKKPDSQDICFVPDGDYRGFLRERKGKEFDPGDILNTKGEIIGKHNGIVDYTIGQRRGLGISFPEPLYVIEKDYERNIIIAGTREEGRKDVFFVDNMNYILFHCPKESFDAKVKIRSTGKEIPAMIEPLSTREAKITLKESQYFISPGQIAAIYIDEYLVGGGIIK